MPPKANKPAAPKKPTKPSAKSKTGNTACSQAASNWQLAIRGKEPLDPQTYATLAKCRSMTRTAKQADDRARMGYNLNEQGAAALKGRLQKRFDQGLITQKSRDERLKTLLQQRKEKQAAVAAKPVTQTVEKLTGTKAVAQRFENAENKFIEHAISHAGLTRPQAVTALNAMTKAKAVKIDPIIGQFSFTHGAFGDKAVIRRAAGIEPAKPVDNSQQSIGLNLNDPFLPIKGMALGKAVELAKKSVPGRFKTDAEYASAIMNRPGPWIDEIKRAQRIIQTEKLTKYQDNFQPNQVQSEILQSMYVAKEVKPYYLDPEDGSYKFYLKEMNQLTKSGLIKDTGLTVNEYGAKRRTFEFTEYGKSKFAVTPSPRTKPTDKAASLVSSVRQKPGYGVARASAAGNRELVGLKMRDKGTVTTQPAKPAFSRQGQLAPGRGTKERSEIAKQKWEDRPRRFLMGQTYLTKSGEPMLIHSKRQGYLTAFPYENGKPVVHSGSAIKFAYTDMAKKIAPDFRTDITNTPANLKETNNTTQSPKPFSRGGQLAPGRGTEERKNLAQSKAEARKLINDTTVKVSSNSFYYNSHDPEKRAKTYSAGYTKDIQSNMRGQVKRAKTANDAKVILDVLKQHVTGMKTRIAAWANAESRTASWAVTGRGNFNSSRNSKRMDSAMNKSQEISDYSKGLENAVSRALLKKSDTGTAITRLAKIRTRLERRKSKLNSDKQIQTRTAVYSARGLDEFANATKEDRSQALKNSMGQLKQIDKDRKTILGRLKKITAAESNLKMQTRISRAL